MKVGTEEAGRGTCLRAHEEMHTPLILAPSGPTKSLTHNMLHIARTHTKKSLEDPGKITLNELRSTNDFRKSVKFNFSKKKCDATA